MNEDRGRTWPVSMIKATWRSMIATLGGQAEVVRAGITRAKPSLISNYGQVSHPYCAPADVMLEVERAVVAAGGTPDFLIAYADALGFVVVPKEGKGAEPEHLARHLGEVASAAAAVIGAVGDSVADGKVTARELDAIEARAGELEREAAELRADARKARSGHVEGAKVVGIGDRR